MDTRRIKPELLELYKDELMEKEYESLEMAVNGKSKREIAAHLTMTVAGVTSLQIRALTQVGQLALTRGLSS